MADRFQAEHQLSILRADNPPTSGFAHARVPTLGGLGHCESDKGFAWEILLVGSGGGWVEGRRRDPCLLPGTRPLQPNQDRRRTFCTASQKQCEQLETKSAGGAGGMREESMKE